jgi:YbbR domain-containing protein
LDFITDNWIQILISLALAAVFFIPVNNAINYFMFEEQPSEIIFEID